MKNAFLFAMCTLVALSARDAAAQVGQAWTDRGYVNLNVGFGSGSDDLDAEPTFSIYDENGTLSLSQAIDSGAFFDLSGGGRVWRNVSVGIAFHQGSTDGEAIVEGSVPHPLVFDRHRRVTLSVGDLTRSERAIHLQFGYMLLLSDRINLHLTVGPSFFKLRQDTITLVDIAEGAGNNTVNATATVAERTDSPTGFNIGADVAYMFYDADPIKVGVGMFLRYTRATADVELTRVVLPGVAGQPQGNVVDSDVGGLQIGFGGRLRF
jgi:hypothetical protein